MVKVPRFEPEVIKAAVDKRLDGDDEKIATTALKELVVEGVKISSRYDKAHEYDVLSRVVQEMPKDLRWLVQEVFCDSKATCTYSVTLRQWDFVDEVAKYFNAALLEHNGGHNGIDLCVAGDDRTKTVWVDPQWRGEE